MNDVECPYCGYENEICDFDHDYPTQDYECGNCGEEFEVTAEIDVIYYAAKIELVVCPVCKKVHRFDGIHGPRPEGLKFLNAPLYRDVCNECFWKFTFEEDNNA